MPHAKMYEDRKSRRKSKEFLARAKVAIVRQR